MSFDITNANKVVWHKGQVTLAERQQKLNQYPLTVWLTGLSGSGKSTLAFALERKLIDSGYACCVLDGDNVRHGLNKDLKFSDDDRAENIRRVAEVARLMNEACIIVISAFISPYQKDRKLAQQIIGEGKFVEVYVNTPIEVCEERDPKGMYKMARSGNLSEFTGVNAPYEAPAKPKISLNTSSMSIEDCVESLLCKLISRIAFNESDKQESMVGRQ